MKILIKSKLGIALTALLVALTANWLYRPAPPPTEHVHLHAGFRVYIEGVRQDYSDPKFMNYTPCSEHNEPKSPEEEQKEKAHLHDGVGDVVHVHREGAKWGDLFTNIDVQLTNVYGYIDGAKVENIMEAEITPYATAIFVVGEDNANLGKEEVTEEHIREVESASELCGTSE